MFNPKDCIQTVNFQKVKIKKWYYSGKRRMLTEYFHFVVNLMGGYYVKESRFYE